MAHLSQVTDGCITVLSKSKRSKDVYDSQCLFGLALNVQARDREGSGKLTVTDFGHTLQCMQLPVSVCVSAHVCACEGLFVGKSKSLMLYLSYFYWTVLASVMAHL